MSPVFLRTFDAVRIQTCFCRKVLRSTTRCGPVDDQSLFIPLVCIGTFHSACYQRSTFCSFPDASRRSRTSTKPKLFFSSHSSNESAPEIAAANSNVSVATHPRLLPCSLWNRFISAGSYIKKLVNKLNTVKTSEKKTDNVPADARASLRELWELLQPERLRIQLALVSLGASAVITLSLPRLMGLLVDSFRTVGKEVSQSDIAGLGLEFAYQHTELIAVAILWGACSSGLRLFLLESASEHIAFHLRLRLFKSLVRKKLAILEQHNIGSLLNRFSGDVTVTSRVLHDISFGIRNAVSAIVSTGAVVYLVPKPLIGTVLYPIAAAFIVGRLCGKSVRRLAQQKQDRLAQLTSVVQEQFSSIRTVRAFNGEHYELARFGEHLLSVAGLAYRMSLTVGARAAFFYSLGGFLTLHLIYRAAAMVSAVAICLETLRICTMAFYQCQCVLSMSGIMSIGDVTSLILYALMAGGSYHGIITAYGDVQKALGSCHALMKLIRDDPAADEETSSAVNTASATPPVQFPEVAGSIEFRNVCFAYPSRPSQRVLNNFSFVIPPGATVALLGESGCGKSTLSLLLHRLYEPQSGAIYVNGVNICSKPPDWVRSRISIVPQDTTLFQATLRENILYTRLAERYRQRSIAPIKSSQALCESTDPEISSFSADDIKELERLAHTAGLIDLLRALPKGADTYVGERGTALSGGQRQRVCLTRGLAKKTNYLILDEATSSLDTASEHAVHDSLRWWLKHRVLTTLVITHRLSALSLADQLAVMKQGTIIQHDTVDRVFAHPCTELQMILAPQHFMKTLST